MKIENIKQLNALVSETYMYAVIIAIVALALAFIVSKMILFQGGRNERSHIKRRVWYIIIGLVAPISFFLYNILLVAPKIIRPPLLAKFSTANIIATLIILGIYIILGIVTMMIFRKSKWGSILGKTK